MKKIAPNKTITDARTVITKENKILLFVKLGKSKSYNLIAFPEVVKKLLMTLREAEHLII